MHGQLKFHFGNGGPLTEAARTLGLKEFSQLCRYVRNLPYGRTSAPANILSVLTEGRGTCSSKHRLLAAIAHECERPDIELMVGIYEMSERNTPGVGRVLASAGFPFIPEAHCYLKHHSKRYDYTGLPAGEVSPFETLRAETMVDLDSLPTTKERLHREAILTWSAAFGVDAAWAWSIREACISALVANQSLQRTRYARR